MSVFQKDLASKNKASNWLSNNRAMEHLLCWDSLIVDREGTLSMFLAQAVEVLPRDLLQVNLFKVWLGDEVIRKTRRVQSQLVLLARFSLAFHTKTKENVANVTSCRIFTISIVD